MSKKKSSEKTITCRLRSAEALRRTAMRKVAAVLLSFAVIFSLAVSVPADSYVEAMSFAGLKSTFSGTWLKKKSKMFNLRETAKFKDDAYGEFSQLQGACTDGKKYAYFAYNRKNDDKVIIVKMKIVKNSKNPSKTKYKFVKKSAVLSGVRHGNDMAYVKDPFGKGQDVIIINSAATGGQHPCYLAFFNPKTMKEIGGGVYRYWQDMSQCTGTGYAPDVDVDPEDRRTLESLVSDHHGYSSLAYNAEKNLIVATVKTDRDFIIIKPTWNTDRTIKSMKLLTYIRQDKINATSQGMDCDDQYIYTSWSPQSGKLGRNILQIYDWSGRHVATRDISKLYEIEHIFHTGSGSKAEFYTNFNYSHTVKKTIKKKVKVKSKKVWKKVNGKKKKVWKCKTKKKKVKTYVFIRDSYSMYLGRLRD